LQRKRKKESSHIYAGGTIYIIPVLDEKTASYKRSLFFVHIFEKLLRFNIATTMVNIKRLAIA